MKKVLNQNLIKSLITSDFLIVEQKKLKQQNFRYKRLTLLSKSQENFFSLDPFEVLTGFKQLIRIFQFLKKSSSLKKELHFFLDENNTTMSSLVKTVLQNKSIKSIVSFSLNSNTHNLPKNFNSKTPRMGFLLDNCISKDKNFFRKQLNKNLFLLFQIYSNPQTLLNTYKIPNILSDYKKILFFLGFLRQILLIRKKG